MWQYVADHIPTLAALGTAALGGIGAAWKRGWRPRRLLYGIAGFFATSKERELSLWTVHQWRERAANAEEWAAYWKAQAEQCLAELHRDRTP